MKQFSWKNHASRLWPYGLCFLVGALSSKAMAPSNSWWILFFTLGLFYTALTKSKSPLQAFIKGWSFGFGYFIFGLYWVGNALLVDGNPYAWAWPVAMAALPVGLALFYGTACALTVSVANLRKIPGYLAFCSIFVLFEWLRGHILTGFPWNYFGYAWADHLSIVQTVAYGSIDVLTWLTLLWVCFGGFLATYSGALSHVALLALVLISSFCGVYSYGSARLSYYKPAYHTDFRIKLVQPNIDQSVKWDRTKMAEHFFRQLRLSYPEDNSDETTYVIWPETALSYRYTDDPTTMELITQALQSYRGDAHLLTGYLSKNPDSGAYANALIAIDKKGGISNIYSKHHLVPFGEYIPLEKVLPLDRWINFSGFTPGEGPKTFRLGDNFSYSPIICYEVIFPGKIIEKNVHSDLIVNVTNDAWYGESAGPYQHFTHAVFRAVEEGVPLVRAANTGISGLIDPVGHTLYKTQLFRENARYLNVPKSLESNNFYKRIIEAAFFIFLGFSIAGGWFTRK